MTDSATNKQNHLPCEDFFRKLADEIGVEFQIVYPSNEKKPTILLSWIGTRPELSSILLNSHMDVVPVFEEFWTHKPFDADMDEEGRIFARGTQDMKSVGMQYLAAIHRFKRNKVSLERTLHVSFVPDEENFGPDGMRTFAVSDAFKKLNVGFVMDEGVASVDEVFNVYYGERSCWHVVFRVYGQPGHGSLLLHDTAAEKLRILLGKMYDYRASQEKILEENPEKTIGDITTLNVTRIKGGKQRNVLPPFIEVTVDIRIAVDVDHQQFETMINKWAKESGERVEIEYEVKEKFCPPTAIDDSNIFWTGFKKAIDEMNLKIKTQIFPAGTDSSYLRVQNIPAIGFSPMNFTAPLLHDHDENLHADIYLKGIAIYENIFEKIGNAN